MQKNVVVWFRQDLRVHDNPALHEALKHGNVLPVYVFDGSLKDPQLGIASKWWLSHSLKKLNEKLSGCLNTYKGNAEKVLTSLVKKYGITHLFFNACYEPGRREQDAHIMRELEKLGVAVVVSHGSLLWEPKDVLKEDGTPYKVFTPFYKNAVANVPAPRAPLSEPAEFDVIKTTDAVAIDALELIDTKHPVNYSKFWEPGEDAALKKLTHFIDHGLDGYAQARDFADRDQTSHLSPYLHFGEISPNDIWHKMQLEKVKSKITPTDREKLLTELCWREFSYSLLYNFPDLCRKNFQSKFDAFPWKSDTKLMHAWQQGRTGYPIVDAGMRQLLQTGYMHNRVRMVVASFLTKNLMQFWRHGADWFWDHLVDADLANNSQNWQWVAGCGVDAAPFFRIFNPVTQGEKFDPTGVYTKKYVPELKNMDIKYLFNPWAAPATVLQKAGVVLGRTYPMPMVEIDETRKKALMAYEKLKN